MNAVPAELRETVQMLKGVWADPSARKGLEPDIAKTFGLSSGFQPYDLAPYAVILQPVFSPLRNKLSRQKRQGKNFEFKAITAVDTSGQTGVATEGNVAGQIATQFADITIGFESYGLASDPVTYEQMWAGEGRDGDFSVDSRALAVANLLKAVMIVEEKLILFGNGGASQITTSGGASWTFGGLVGTPTTPTLAAGTSGSMTGTVNVKITQVTGMGESLPSAAANNAFGTASNGSLTVSVARKANTPVIKYNIYASTDGTNYYLQGSTNGAPFAFTSVTTGTANPPTADASGNTGAFAGMWSYLFASGSGAQLNNVAATLASLDPLNVVLENIWNASYGDPDDVWMNAHEVRTISKLLVGSGSPYYLTYDDAGQRDVVGNARVSRILNPVTSKVMPVNVHAYIPQGSILVTSTTLPAWYVGNNVPSVWGMELTQDYIEIDYEPTRSAPTWQSEIRCYGGLSCYVPSVNGLVYGISP